MRVGGQGVLSLGCNSGSFVQRGQHVSAVSDYHKLAPRPDTAIIARPDAARRVTTQDPVLEQRSSRVGEKRVRNYLQT